MAENQEKTTERNTAKAGLSKLVNNNVYNNLGIAPTSATFVIGAQKLNKALKDLADSNLKGVDSVTIMTQPGEAPIRAFIWFKKNSQEVTPKSSPNLAINVQRNYISQELKNFMKKFCNENRRKLITAAEDHNKKGIEINFNIFLGDLLDFSGKDFAAISGGEPVKSALDVKKRFSGKGQRGDFNGIEVTKTPRYQRPEYLTPSKSMSL